jgi:Flp pilus assembly protein TadD
MRFFPTILFFVLSAAALASTVVPAVPDDSRDAADQARNSFEQGDFSGAEKLYEQILKNHPDNLYALSNLGVVQFRLGNMPRAEETLQRAIAIAPDDAFSHCTLGLVYYQQHLFDRATSEFARALAIDPKNSEAKELMTAVRGGARSYAPPSVGDFETPHERLLRQAPGLPASVGEIGLKPSDF